jgi:hypothetical protein
MISICDSRDVLWEFASDDADSASEHSGFYAFDQGLYVPVRSTCELVTPSSSL